MGSYRSWEGREGGREGGREVKSEYRALSPRFESARVSNFK